MPAFRPAIGARKWRAGGELKESAPRKRRIGAHLRRAALYARFSPSILKGEKEK